jgi:hypothetical protein
MEATTKYIKQKKKKQPERVFTRFSDYLLVKFLRLASVLGDTNPDGVTRAA